MTASPTPCSAHQRATSSAIASIDGCRRRSRAVTEAGQVGGHQVDRLRQVRRQVRRRGSYMRESSGKAWSSTRAGTGRTYATSDHPGQPVRLPDSVVVEPCAEGRNWAVSTPHARATDAAAAVFEQGGNAIDAALVAATTLAVVYPHMCGVGGDLFALVRPARRLGRGRQRQRTRTRRCRPRASPSRRARLDAPVRTHHRDRPGSRERLGGTARPRRNPGVGPPCSMPRSLRPTRESPVSRPWPARSVDEHARLRGDPGLRDRVLRQRILDVGARPLREGEVVRQPQLAPDARGTSRPTVLTPGTDGPDGARYVAGLSALGVPLTTDDLAAHSAQVGQPPPTRTTATSTSWCTRRTRRASPCCRSSR